MIELARVYYYVAAYCALSAFFGFSPPTWFDVAYFGALAVCFRLGAFLLDKRRRA